jgi:hypothetical protein
MSRPRQQLRRGRPANPYSGDDPRWKKRGTWDWLDSDSDIHPVKPASIPSKDIRWAAYGIIRDLGVPVLRRVLEAILVFDHSLSPDAVTMALDGLMESEYLGGKHVVVTKFKCGSELNNLYSFQRKPTSAELGYLRKAYAERQRVLSNATLKLAGERYVRAAIIKSGKYRNITQTARLGKVTDANSKHALDLVATHKQTGITYGISVKNQRAWLYPDSPAIKDAYTKAMSHGVKPWLIVPFASASAIARCNHNGIRLTRLHAQIVPSEDHKLRPMSSVIERLRAVIGPQPFKFLPARNSRAFSNLG